MILFLSPDLHGLLKSAAMTFGDGAMPEGKLQSRGVHAFWPA